MKTIDEDIKNKTFRQCYLLCGEEAYLKRQYRDKLISAQVRRDDTMNFAAYEGKNIRPGELIDLAETMPFFSERRVILVEESGFFKNACDMLADYLPQVGRSTCFIFVESEVDKRSRMYKAVKKYGAAVEFAIQSEAIVTKWILSRIKKEKKNIEKLALQEFLGRSGPDLGTVDGELEKLLCFTLEKEAVEMEDVAAIVTERAENKVFEMVDAIAGKNRKRALDLYYDLLALKEPPMRILFLIARQLRLLAEIKEMSKQGCANSDIAEKAGVPGFAVRKYQAQAKGFTGEELLLALENGVNAEECVKTGKMNEKIAVELFIISITGNK